MIAVASTLDEKVLSVYSGRGIIVHKGLAQLSDHFKVLPRYVADYLIMMLVKDPANPGAGIAKIEKLIAENHIETADKELVKSRIVERGRYSLIGPVRIRSDMGPDGYLAEIPVLSDVRVRIPRSVFAPHEDAMLTAGLWGRCEIAYDPNQEGTVGRSRARRSPFVVTGFKPLQVTEIDFDDWIDSRNEFTDSEWIDLIVTSIGFDPVKIDDQAKLLYLVRLVPLVEANVNMVELGPPESGKTYTYRSVSSYSFVVSGGNTTIPSLFFNQAKRRIGLLGIKDCVLFDEIARAKPADLARVMTSLMDYMSSDGRFGVGQESFSSDCSLVLNGNIDCDRQARTVNGYYRHLFEPLPAVISDDRAFLDRIHGYIPGWRAPQIMPDNYANTHGWMADYFGEVMHRMRQRNCVHVISDRIRFGKMGHRSQTALSRIASGLIKLVYPHRTAETIQDDELTWALDQAVELRQRVIDQLAVIRPLEFGGVKLSYALR